MKKKILLSFVLAIAVLILMQSNVYARLEYYQVMENCKYWSK